MKPTSKLLLFVFTFLALSASTFAQEPSPREQLQQLTAQLQQTPSDTALRERIIKLALEITPAPAVPPEAKRPFVMAGTYQKEAKKPSDFALAIDAYQDALKVAPWWGDAYYNLSVSLESVSRLDEARDALRLYLLTKPNDAEEAQNRLYALDAKKTIAAKQTAEAAAEKAQEDKVAAAKKAEEEKAAKEKVAAERERLRPSVEGRWDGGIIDFQVTKSGENFAIIPGLLNGRLPNRWVATDITVDRQRVRFGYKNLYVKSGVISYLDLSLSESGNELKGTATLNGEAYQNTFKRVP
jgi:tetratricopeptide (TPR) repeat protein